MRNQRSTHRAKRIRAAVAVLGCLTVLFGAGGAWGGEVEPGFHSIFDGKSLKNWDGDPQFWRVEDGAITGQTTPDNPTKGNTFIIWTGGEVGDFELKLEYRIVGGNSGIQYRSFRLENAADRWRIGGYQADLEAGERYSGICYGEQFRGILADRGQKTVIEENGKPRVVGSVGNSEEIAKAIKKEDWNEYHIIARGFHFVQKINGVTTCELTDEDADVRRDKGLLALQLHAGPPMKVQFRKIRLKTLEAEQHGNTETSAGVAPSSATRKKKVVLIAGKPSHGYGAHEHRAGCLLLAKALNESGLPVAAEVVTGGWPQDASVLDDADSIVIYADGGGGHPFNAHLDELNQLMKKGVGLVCIHYAVEVPKGASGDAFLEWTGGYFETNWSVNPHWTAQFKHLPKHPIANGVKPFSINDEWYYHMRFRENMEGVTPILSDLPPEETLKRPDGSHSNNPFVRKAVLEERQSQHTAWTRERPDGGRGFGFTGGHVHWNWGHDQFRKLVLNAIVWTAGLEVPVEGVPSKRLTVEDLMANQDYQPPADFNPARIQALLDEWNTK